MDFRGTSSTSATASRAVDHAHDDASPKDNWDHLTRRERIVASFDISMQVICSQIASDYTTFFRNAVQPAIARERRLSIRHHTVLLGLASFAHSISGAELARFQRTDKATTSRSLSVLRKAGLINEEPDPEDARSRLVCLSDAGRALNEDYLVRWQAAIDAADASHRARPQTRMSEDAFTTRFDQLNRMRDRAKTFADYRPGRMGAFEPGIARIAPVHRHTPARRNRIPDMYVRYFADFISQDYITCFNERAVRPIIGERDINFTDLSVLMAVVFNDISATQAEISATLRFDSATVTRSAQALKDEGLVDIVTLDGDKRTRGLKLTTDGQRLGRAYRTRATRLVASVERHFNMHWSQAEKSELLDTFVAMRRRAAMLAEFKA